ncbi:MAG: hypothetical protein ABI718_04860 [Acidobacteriota bacterium]
MTETSPSSFSRRYGVFMFSASALMIIATCATIVRSSIFARNQAVIASGAIFDLCVTTPGLYYLFIVRGGRARLRSIFPVVLGCLVAARLILPQSSHAILSDLRLLLLPVEVVLVTAVVVRARRAIRTSHQQSEGRDPPRAIRSAVAELTGDFRRAGDILASEITIVYYALLGWREKPPVDRPDQFTSYKLSGWGTIFAALALMIGSETIGVHLLVQLWSPTAAWVITALDLYTILWLLGDYQGLRLLPTEAGETVIRIRLGLRWSVDVPYEAIKAIGTEGPAADSRAPGYLKLAILDAPQFVIHLVEPLTAKGIFGLQRSVRDIGILVDDPSGFRQTLEKRGVVFGHISRAARAQQAD